MANRITLDFENNIITWDTDTQKGTEYCLDLADRKSQILAAMGYSQINFAPAIRIFEDLINGKISKEDAKTKLADFERGGESQ